MHALSVLTPVHAAIPYIPDLTTTGPLCKHPICIMANLATSELNIQRFDTLRKFYHQSQAPVTSNQLLKL
uniref:Uncharacterized protein n=1 Tax=Leptobrachium leishanense TaxID=445787 RepID=A0A8C5LY97_9ANUR